MTDVEFNEDVDTSGDGHYITTKIEVYEVYQTKYDKDKDSIVVGPSDFENKEDESKSEEKHICSCGKKFDNREESHKHLKKEY